MSATRAAGAAAVPGGGRRDPRAVGALWALLGAHAVSQTGNVITAFAIPFYVLGLGGSGIEVGIAAFFATAPVVLGGAFGGVLVDRIGHRRAAVIADLVSGVAVLSIPVIALTAGLPFWGLLALVFVGGMLDTPGQTARRVMLPALTERASMRLEGSVGFLDGSERLAKMIGASLAGLLIAAVGPMAALFVNAATFGVSALMTACLVPSDARLRAEAASRGAGEGAVSAGSGTLGEASGASAPDGAPAPSGYWADLREGLRFVVRDPLMRLILPLVLVANIMDAARGSTLLPLYAQDRLGGAAALGLLVAVMGVGALIGTVGFGLIAHRVPRRVTFAVCFALVGGPSSLGFALGAPLPVLVALSALSGLAAGSINPILGTVLLERVPAHMRGRVFGLVGAGSWAGVPFGALLGGVAAETIGLPMAFGIIAVLYTLVTLTPLTGGTWRRMERPAPGPGPAVSEPGARG